MTILAEHIVALEAVTSSASTSQTGSSYQPSTRMTSIPLLVVITRWTHLFAATSMTSFCVATSSYRTGAKG
jgi:hypothetical protein